MSDVLPFPGAPAPAPSVVGPVNVEAEQAVLGAILINNDALGAVAAILDESHFCEDAHRRIFAAAAAMVAAGQVASPVTLKSFLPDGDLVPGMSVPTYLVRLASAAPSIAAAPAYARTVRDLAARRGLIAAAGDLAERSRLAGVADDPAALAADALSALQEIAGQPRGVDTRREAGASAAALLKRARAIQTGEVKDRGVSTGLKDLDRMTGGFQPGTLWIVAGRPGMGKTLLATGFALKVARRGARDAADRFEGVGAMLFSLEVPEHQITARLLADMAYSPRRPIPFGALMRGQVDDEDMWALEDAQARLAALPLTIDVAPGLSVLEIAARIRAEQRRQAAAGFRLGVVFVDYLKFIKASDRYRGLRVYEVGEISGALKQLAKELDLCVVLLAQLSRAVEGRDRKDRRPQLSDLRDSGDLEADADVVAFVYREAYYIKNSPEYRNNNAEALAAFAEAANAGEIIVEKTRAGETGKTEIFVDMAASHFAQKETWRG